MVGSVSERLGKLQGWIAIAEKRKLLWRAGEWLLALAWPIVAYNVVFNRYGWKSDYYNRWGEIWFALVLLAPMAGPAVVRLFSGNRMELHKRFALAALMLLGIALAMNYRPMLGGLTFTGFVVPMALQASA